MAITTMASLATSCWQQSTARMEKRGRRAPGNTLTGEVCFRLNQLDNRVLTRYAKTLEKNYERRESVTRMLSRRDNGLLDVLYMIRIFEEEQAAESLKKMADNGISVRTREDIAMLYAVQEPLLSLYPAPLHMLKKLIEEWNAAHSEGLSLLTCLENVFGGVAKLAPALSIAKKSRISGFEANQLQNKMLMNWLNQNIPVNEVFALLKLSDLETRGLTYENLDTLIHYLALYKVKHHGADVDYLKCLRQNFDDIRIVRMIIKARGMSSYPNDILKDLVNRWMLEDNTISLIDIANKFFAAGNDESMVLHLLLTVYPDVSNFARTLSLAKMDPTTSVTAKRLQTNLLTIWLGRGLSVDNVYDLLRPRNSGTAGQIFENLDTLAEYIALRNGVHHGANTDMLMYLRQKFGAVKIIRMIVDARKMSPYPNEIFKGLVLQWRHARKSLMYIADKVFKAVKDESTVLDLLVTAYGSVAIFARSLSAAKKGPKCGTKAKSLENKFLTSLLDSQRTIVEVYDLLDIPKDTRNARAYKNLDSFIQYVALYNERAHANINASEYVRERLEAEQAHGKPVRKRQRLDGRFSWR